MHWSFYLLTVFVALSDIIIIISSFKKVFKSETRQPVAVLFLENPHSYTAYREQIEYKATFAEEAHK